MKKRIKKRLKIAGILAAIALTGAWATCWPVKTINSQRKNNLLLTRNGSWLATASPATQLYNRILPDRNQDRGRIMIIRPENVDDKMLYPVIIVQQQESEDFKDLTRRWQGLDSCYVIITSQDQTQPNGNSGLNMLDSTLVYWLDGCGMRIDPNFMTLVDRSKTGALTTHFTHRRLRNLVLTQAACDTTLHAARRIHFCPNNMNDSLRMQRSYQALADKKADTDIYPTRSPLTQIVRNIVLDKYPVSQSRLNDTHHAAIERGYNTRYAMFADFSIPSGKNRFFVFDYDNDKVIISSKCAHGCGSGSTNATPRFSNENGSCATSLGLYEIDDVHRMYKNNRTAINLEGLEQTNNNARMRGIKVHGGMGYEGEIYPRFLQIGRLSEGCFALSNLPFARVMILVEQTAPSRILLNAYTH